MRTEKELEEDKFMANIANDLIFGVDHSDFEEQAPIEPDAIFLLLEELEAMGDRVTAELAEQSPIQIPDNYQDIADLYISVNEVHNRFKNIYESLRHNRELLKVAATKSMENRGIGSIIGTDGAKVSDIRTIYASVKDRLVFVEWAREKGEQDLIETKERKGSAKIPGLDAHVRYLVKRARETGGDPQLPPGVEYSETVRLQVTKPSEGNKFDDGAKGILERLKEHAADQKF